MIEENRRSKEIHANDAERVALVYGPSGAETTYALRRRQRRAAQEGAAGRLHRGRAKSSSGKILRKDLKGK